MKRGLAPKDCHADRLVHKGLQQLKCGQFILKQTRRALKIIGHEPDMVYLPPKVCVCGGGGVQTIIFKKAQCLRSILQHVGPLAVGEFPCNSLL